LLGPHCDAGEKAQRIHVLRIAQQYFPVDPLRLLDITHALQAQPAHQFLALRRQLERLFELFRCLVVTPEAVQHLATLETNRGIAGFQLGSPIEGVQAFIQLALHDQGIRERLVCARKPGIHAHGSRQCVFRFLRTVLLQHRGTQQAQQVRIARERVQRLATQALRHTCITRPEKRHRPVERGSGGVGAAFLHVYLPLVQRSLRQPVGRTCLPRLPFYSSLSGDRKNA
jgi:hypothetical protein